MCDRECVALRVSNQTEYVINSQARQLTAELAVSGQALFILTESYNEEKRTVHNLYARFVLSIKKKYCDNEVSIKKKYCDNEEISISNE